MGLVNSVRRLVLIAAAVLGIGSNVARADLKVGVDSAPYVPFAAPDASGKWVGWEIDFLDALCAELKETCVIVPTSWPDLIPALDVKKIDLIVASMTITDERRKGMAFSQMYYEIPTVIVGRKDGDLNLAPDHLAGKTLAVQTATAYQAHAAKVFVPAGAKLKNFQTLDEANQELVAGHADYVEADAASLDDFLRTGAGLQCCELKGRVPADALLGEGVGVGLRKDDAELLARVNTAIQALTVVGKFKDITARYTSLGPVIVTP